MVKMASKLTFGLGATDWQERINVARLQSGRSEAEYAAARDKFTKGLPLDRMGRPEDVAFVVDFLMSERSSYISGQIIHPNGGQLMW